MIWTVLTWSTVIVAAIIVVVLAVTLISVAVALLRAAKLAGALAAGLEVVGEQTDPLAESLTTINGALSSLLGGLRVVEGNFTALVRALGLE